MRSSSALFCAVLFGAVLFGQTQGEISGEVTDSSGSAVVGATLTITNAQTNAVRSVVSNNSGLYSVPGLVPGSYSVRAALQGFQPVLRGNIELQVQQTARVDFTLRPGDVNQTIDVNASAQMLTTDDATVGTVIENKRVVDLPLNGRDFLQLVSLSPNVTSGFGAPGQAAARQGGTRATENFSVMGQRGTANYYTLDGISNTDVNFNLYIFLPPSMRYRNSRCKRACIRPSSAARRARSTFPRNPAATGFTAHCSSFSGTIPWTPNNMTLWALLRQRILSSGTNLDLRWEARSGFRKFSMAATDSSSCRTMRDSECANRRILCTLWRHPPCGRAISQHCSRATLCTIPRAKRSSMACKPVPPFQAT